jgi:hypothetical protein
MEFLLDDLYTTKMGEQHRSTNEVILWPIELIPLLGKS